MQKRIAFIMPFFGRFNNYFKVWLQSCRCNPDIDWLIFTDDTTTYDYPPNVKLHICDFSFIKELVQKQFDFKINLASPLQIYDYRVAFGEIFESYLKQYDFWGYCDADVIWGNLRYHLSDAILSNYSKISMRGHCTLIKNSAELNKLYKTKIYDLEYYKYAFTVDTKEPLYFDEGEINFIFEAAGEKIYKELIFADLKIRSFNFQTMHFSAHEQYKNVHQVFYWEEGNLYRLYEHEGILYKDSFAYIHFLKRPMSVEGEYSSSKRILIVPNKFIYVDRLPDVNAVKKYGRQRFYYEYVLSKFSFQYIRDKITHYKNQKYLKQHYNFLSQKKADFIFPDLKSEKLSIGV